MKMIARFVGAGLKPAQDTPTAGQVTNLPLREIAYGIFGAFAMYAGIILLWVCWIALGGE